LCLLKESLNFNLKVKKIVLFIPIWLIPSFLRLVEKEFDCMKTLQEEELPSRPFDQAKQATSR